MKIGMVTYSYYEGDTRVMRYAEALSSRGDAVDVYALRRQGQEVMEVVHGVNVHRIQGRKQNDKSKWTYAFGVMLFLLRTMWKISREHLRQRYKLIHIHSVPDFLVFAAFVPRLTGTKIILDIHDLLPEFYASKYGVKSDSFVFRFLVMIERISVAFSDYVIAANDLWLSRLTSRSCKASNCIAMVNFPDLSVFAPAGKNRSDGKFIIMYPGSLNWHQGLDIAIRAFSLIKDEFPNAEFHIYGDGPYRVTLLELIRELNLPERVFVRDTMDTRKIARLIEDADLGVVPKRRDGFGDEAFSTKIMEFMALQVPVIVADTTVDKYYFSDAVVKFFKSGDEKDLARVMASVIRDPNQRSTMVKNAKNFVDHNNWGLMQPTYLKLVDQLVTSKKGSEMKIQPDACN